MKIRHRLTHAVDGQSVIFEDDAPTVKETAEHGKKKLSGADLAGVDLAGADLSGADLSFSDLSRANLEGTNLEGANLKGAFGI